VTSALEVAGKIRGQERSQRRSDFQFVLQKQEVTLSKSKASIAKPKFGRGHFPFVFLLDIPLGIGRLDNLQRLGPAFF